MSQVMQAVCPGCRSLLHIPSAWLAQPVRCKGCGMVMQPQLPTPAPTPPPSRLRKADPSAPSPFDFVEDGGPRRRRRNRTGNWLGALVAFLILALTAGLGYGVYVQVIKPREQARNAPDQADSHTLSVPGSGDSGVTAYPRRVLFVSVHNYLYANPIIDGPKDSPNLDRLTTALSRALRISTTQIVHLSDAAKKTPRAPWKVVVEQGLVNFLKTTRKQDRVLVVFVGHTKEIDNKPYLVPLDGELDNPATLLPLDWVYQQLAACDCRQKVLVLDGNRFNAGQGEERPASGPMGAKFEAALKSPPAGVQVWSACSAGQQSREFEESSLGLFLDSLRLALMPEGGQKGALDGKRPQPDDLFPVEALHEAVQERMSHELERRKLGKQIAFLAGQAPESGAAYDRGERAAELPAFPVLDTGDRQLVKALLEEISLPPVRGGEATSVDVSLDLFPPFPLAGLKKYEGADLPANSKLRKAIQEARAALWAVSTSQAPKELAAEVARFRTKVTVDLSIMRDRFGKPGEGAAEAAFKNRVFEDGRSMARIVGRLENVLDNLEEAGEEKEAAPLRWQVHYDFLHARFQAQLAYLEEYQGLLGQIRKELPEHDPNLHSGFRMASKEKAGDSLGKKLERAARKIYGDLGTANPGTPWEVLAKREKLTALGLEWKAY